MSEFKKENEQKRKTANEWVERFRGNFDRTLTSVKRHQEIKILTAQVILLTISGAILVNMLTSSLYTLFVNFNPEHVVISINHDVLIVLISSAFLVIIFFRIKSQFSKYGPNQPVLSLIVKPEDMKDFLYENQYEKIMRYLDEGKLIDFRGFGKSFFANLEGWFTFIFNEDVPKKALREFEITKPPSSKQYPTIVREYDISQMSTTGVKVKVEVQLLPHIIYDFKGNSSIIASYAFYVAFRFRILNPEHCHADNFLEEYFHRFASNIVSHTSYSVNLAFSRIIPNFFKPKIIKKSRKKHSKRRRLNRRFCH